MTQKVKVVILTKSDKQGGYCVAGITEHGKWVRLVTNKKGAALDKKKCTYTLLDIIDAEVEPCPIPFQPENIKLLNYQIVEKTDLETIIQRFNLLCKTDYAFLNLKQFLKEVEMQKLENSLIILKGENIESYRNDNGKWKAKFTYNRKEYREISVTDPNYFKQSFKVKNAYLVMSLPPDAYEINDMLLYYKFIAAIYPC